MSSSIPGVNLSSSGPSGTPSFQEFLLQGSILDQSSEALLNRLRALCDNIDCGPELFNDHEMVFMLRGSGNQITLRARHSLEHPASPWQLRYVGGTDLSDKMRHVSVRGYIDCATSSTLPGFLSEIGFKLDHEFVAEGQMFRKGRMKVTVSKIYKMQKPRVTDASSLEPLSTSKLVELSVVAPSGSENIGEDMRNFAEQLKPLVTMEKV